MRVEFELEESFLEEAIQDAVNNCADCDSAVSEWIDEHMPTDEKLLEWVHEAAKEIIKDHLVTQNQFKMQMEVIQSSIQDRVKIDTFNELAARVTECERQTGGKKRWWSK